MDIVRSTLMPSKQSQSLHLTWHIHLGGECILQSLFALTMQMTLLSNCRLMIDNVTEPCYTLNRT